MKTVYKTAIPLMEALLENSFLEQTKKKNNFLVFHSCVFQFCFPAQIKDVFSLAEHSFQISEGNYHRCLRLLLTILKDMGYFWSSLHYFIFQPFSLLGTLLWPYFRLSTSLFITFRKYEVQCDYYLI